MEATRTKSKVGIRANMCQHMQGSSQSNCQVWMDTPEATEHMQKLTNKQCAVCSNKRWAKFQQTIYKTALFTRLGQPVQSILSTTYITTQCTLSLLSSDTAARLDMSRPFCSQARLNNASAFL